MRGLGTVSRRTGGRLQRLFNRLLAKAAHFQSETSLVTIMKSGLHLFLASLFVLSPCWAAGQAHSQSAQSSTGATAAAPSADASVNDIMARVRATAENANSDLGKLKIDKWKTDATSKKQTQASADSIQRNLTAAVPQLLDQLRATPNSLIVNFRLYRDLNALFDAFSGLTESAGAFGPPDQYSALAGDLVQLDQARQKLANRIDSLAGTTEAELARLRARPTVAPNQTPAQPTKIVVDDSPTAAKKKRKAPATKPAPQ
jgi:hypothetical protein